MEISMKKFSVYRGLIFFCLVIQQQILLFFCFLFQARFIILPSHSLNYGWESEEQRITAHRRLLSVIKAHSGVLFLSQEQCFAFVGALAGARLEDDRFGTGTDKLCASDEIRSPISSGRGGAGLACRLVYLIS